MIIQIKFNKIKYFILIFLLITTIGYSQTKFKTLEIDTLINKYGLTIDQTDSVINSRSPDGMASIDFNANTTQYKMERTPNFRCSVYLTSDTSVVRIRIDNKFGYVDLHNLYSVEDDTIRIEKLEIRKNCLNDTTFTKVVYWYESDIGVRVEPPFNTENSIKVHKGKCKLKHPIVLELKINGQNYYSIMHYQQHIFEVFEFTGRKPKAYQKEREKYKGEKRIYYETSKVKVLYKYIFAIRIKST